MGYLKAIDKQERAELRRDTTSRFVAARGNEDSVKSLTKESLEE